MGKSGNHNLSVEEVADRFRRSMDVTHAAKRDRSYLGRPKLNSPPIVAAKLDLPAQYPNTSQS